MKRYWSRNARLLLFILLLLGGLLLAAELWVDESITTAIGFYAGVGFLSCMTLIAIALLIGKIIKRRDSYYEH